MEKLIFVGVGLLICVAAYILARKQIIKPVIMALIMTVALGAATVGVFYPWVKPIPTVELIGEKEITLCVTDEYKEQGARAILDEEDISSQIVIKGAVDTAKLGNYTVTYELNWDEKNYSVQRMVHVIDTTNPEIKLNGNDTVTVSAIEFYKEKGATATDNYDGDLTSKVETVQNKTEDNNYEITYTVKDSSGNSATTKRKIIIKDIVAPIITLKGSKNITVLKGGTFTDAGYSASDDLDGDLTKAVNVSGSVDTSIIGTYNITYTVSDKAGNKATVNRRVTVNIPDTNSVICLTFDDGPSTTVTPRILDILKANNVKATFFIVNYNNSTLPLIKRMIAEGHAIGIHGYSHDWSIYNSEEKFMDNIYKLRDKLYNDTGYKSTIMRFPGGSSNKVSISHCKGVMTRLVERVQNEGWRYFDWNVSSGDADGVTVAKNTLINNFKAGVKTGRTNVVLCHDIGSKTTTADALQSYIDYGREKGFTFSAISETTPQCHHGVNN